MGLCEVLWRTLTALSVLCQAIGYHVWSEISESRRPGCPPEFMHIKVQKEDPVFGSNSSQPVLLQFQRAKWDPSTGNSPNNPRTQVNHVTAWIDGSSIYGSSSSWCDALRAFSRGRLASGSSQDMPRRSSSGAGACGAGVSPREPDVSLSLSEQDLLAMFEGDLRPFTAYSSGRLRVQGDLNTAMKLETLVKLLKTT